MNLKDRFNKMLASLFAKDASTKKQTAQGPAATKLAWFQRFSRPRSSSMRLASTSTELATNPYSFESQSSTISAQPRLRPRASSCVVTRQNVYNCSINELSCQRVQPALPSQPPPSTFRPRASSCVDSTPMAGQVWNKGPVSHHRCNRPPPPLPKVRPALPSRPPPPRPRLQPLAIDHYPPHLELPPQRGLPLSRPRAYTAVTITDSTGVFQNISIKRPSEEEWQTLFSNLTNMVSPTIHPTSHKRSHVNVAA